LYEGLYLSLRGEHIKDTRLHYFQFKNVNFEIFIYILPVI